MALVARLRPPRGAAGGSVVFTPAARTAEGALSLASADGRSAPQAITPASIKLGEADFEPRSDESTRTLGPDGS